MVWRLLYMTDSLRMFPGLLCPYIWVAHFCAGNITAPLLGVSLFCPRMMGELYHEGWDPLISEWPESWKYLNVQFWDDVPGLWWRSLIVFSLPLFSNPRKTWLWRDWWRREGGEACHPAEPWARWLRSRTNQFSLAKRKRRRGGGGPSPEKRLRIREETMKDHREGRQGCLCEHLTRG